MTPCSGQYRSLQSGKSTRSFRTTTYGITSYGISSYTTHSYGITFYGTTSHGVNPIYVNLQWDDLWGKTLDVMWGRLWETSFRQDLRIFSLLQGNSTSPWLPSSEYNFMNTIS